MALQADIFNRCLQEASTTAKPALERCIDHAVSALQVAETQSMKVAERDELGLAWRELLKFKTGWCTRYPVDLMAAFKQPHRAAARDAAAPTPRAAPGADMFSLVDDTQVEEGIESSRLLQQVAPVVDQVLSELDSLMSSAQGLSQVSPEANPVRPEIYVQTLRTLLADAPVPPVVNALWIRHLGEPLGRELKLVYERLINVLELAQVQAASYRVLQTPASNGRKPGRAGAGTGLANNDGDEAAGEGGPIIGYASDEPSGRAPSQYADLSNYEIKDALFQDFLFGGGSNANHGLAPSYYATIEEELIALKATPDSEPAVLQPEPRRRDSSSHSDHGHADHSYHGTRSDPRHPTVPEQDAWDGPDTPSRIVDVLSQLSSQVWGVYGRARERALVRTQLKKDATRVGQVLGMEVVKKLVNQVAQDPRLLVPVREAIVALEPSLLRLAMVDSRFFSEESHPGRRLMERVAQRSFKYNDARSPQFEVFFQSVTEAFNGLNALAIEDARPFGAALADLQNLWDEQDQQGQAQRSNMRQTMQFAEERQAQADQIAYDMSMRADLEHVPGVVLDFLFGPWALVLAHARLTDTARQIDPEGYGSLVTDLLWSVKREVTLKRPAKLIAMIPGLLSKLYAGLASLRQDPRETEAFFNAMEKLHRPVLKLRRVRSQRDAAESEAAPLEMLLAEADASDMSDLQPATAEQRKAKTAGQPWLAPEDLDDAGFEDTLPSGPGELTSLSDDNDSDLAALNADNDSGNDDDEGDADEQTADDGVHAPSPEDILQGLREGSWVDLYSKRHWLRAQLIWASTRGTLFMFVSHGGRPHSMTKRSCERLIKEQLLRPVESHGVVAHALDHLVNEARPTATEDSTA